MKKLIAWLFVFAWVATAAPATAQTGGAGRVVMNFAAGGPGDLVARIIAEGLSKRQGRTFIVENISGASGGIGAAAVARTAPDGATLLVTLDTVLTVNPHLYKALPFDPAKLEPIAIAAGFEQVLVVNPAVPATTLGEFIALARRHGVTYGSAGVGSPGHLTFEYLRHFAKFDATHIPYKGAGPVIADLLSGQIQSAFIVQGAILPHARQGKVRPLAISTAIRSELLPAVPSLVELGYSEFDVRFMYLVMAPAGVPRATQESYSREIKEIVSEPDASQKLRATGAQPLGGSPAETKTWIERERARWGEVIRTANITAG